MNKKIEKLIISYVSKRLDTIKVPFEKEAFRKVDEIKKSVKSVALEDLTKSYFETSPNPTLIGWERYCRTNALGWEIT